LITAVFLLLFDNFEVPAQTRVPNLTKKLSTLEIPLAKSFRGDILEEYLQTAPIFIDLQPSDLRRDIPSVSPLEEISYAGISKTDPLFS
jgi:hypothetical protein